MGQPVRTRHSNVCMVIQNEINRPEDGQRSAPQSRSCKGRSIEARLRSEFEEEANRKAEAYIREQLEKGHRQIEQQAAVKMAEMKAMQERAAETLKAAQHEWMQSQHSG